MFSILKGLDLELKPSKEAGIFNFIKKEKKKKTQWPPLAEGGGEKSI